VNNEQAHALSRKRGTSKFIYGLARFLLTPVAFFWFRFRVSGAEHVPDTGPAVIAPNHKSFYDSFFIGLATKRPLHFMAKTELIDGTWYGRLLCALGAFPVRRGEADPDALETARVHLEKGRVLAMFPEGTRHRDPDALRAPKRGPGRLAIEAQAPIVPCAITGTEKLFIAGFIPKPIKVQVAFAPAITPAQLEATPAAAAELIHDQVWPEVEREFRRLRANPGLIAAIVAALSAGTGVAIRAQTKPKTRRQKVAAALPKPKVKLKRRKKKGGVPWKR
jgi:1-acyl-sn-glycerol-3-phosphate acyltransferase